MSIAKVGPTYTPPSNVRVPHTAFLTNRTQDFPGEPTLFRSKLIKLYSFLAEQEGDPSDIESFSGSNIKVLLH